MSPTLVNLAVLIQAASRTTLQFILQQCQLMIFTFIEVGTSFVTHSIVSGIIIVVVIQIQYWQFFLQASLGIAKGCAAVFFACTQRELRYYQEGLVTYVQPINDLPPQEQ